MKLFNSFSAIKVLWLAPFLLLGMAQQSSALTGGPDAGGYSFTDSNEVSGPAFNYVDISASGTPVSLYDDSSRVVPIGFSFSYYGVNYSSINVGSNGFLSFNAGNYGRYYEGPIPGNNSGMPATVLAPFWDDIYPRYGQVRYQTMGAAPNRKFIVQYRAPFYYNSGTNDFEVILTEGTHDVLFQYNYAGASRNTGTSAAVGIQRDPSIGLAYSFRQARISAGLAIVFSDNYSGSNAAPTANAGSAQAVECTGGSSANATLNGALSSDPDGDALTYAWSWAGGSAAGVSPTASFPIGATLVSLTVKDGNGHTSTVATATITVQDTMPPTVNAGADVTIEATSASGMPFDVAAQATATDNCCSVSTSISPVGIYPVGDTTVTVSSTDCAGNTATDTMIVHVVDAAPILRRVPADIQVTRTGILTPVNLPWGLFAYDRIDGQLRAPRDYRLGGFPVGTTIVTYSVTDSHGNTASASVIVKVLAPSDSWVRPVPVIPPTPLLDTTAPMLLRIPTDVTVMATGILTPVALPWGLFAYDAHDGYLRAPRDYRNGGFPVGTTPVTYSVSDAAGNTATATVNVTVIAPWTPPL